MLPVAAVFSHRYLLQSVLINPFVGRAEHEQFICCRARMVIVTAC